MIAYCDQQCCKNRKICAVYDVLSKHSDDIQVFINSCFYLSKGQQLQYNDNFTADPVALSERVERIRTLQVHKKSLDAPQAIRSVKSMGMQFVIDDKAID